MRIAAVSSVMLVAMSVPLLVMPVHLNLACLAGILLGGWQALVAAFCVSVIGGLLQHGGITAVGINTLILAAEAGVASLVYRRLTRLGPAASAVIASALAVMLATSLMMGALLVATPDDSPLEAIAAGLLGHEEHEHEHLAAAYGHYSSANAVLRTLLPVLAIGLAFEVAATACITGFIARVRPTLLRKD